jgi:hypothetical protein
MQHDPYGWRGNERRLIEGLRYLGKTVLDPCYGRDAWLVFEPPDDGEDARREHEIVNLTDLARALDFIK